MSKIEVFSTLEIGAYGEKLAKDFLKEQNYKIVLTNFSIRLGRNFLGRPITGEIDIIAYDQETLCFIEVKTRTSNFLAPEKAVDLAKQRQISRVAKRFLEIFQLKDHTLRFDVVAILLEKSKPTKPNIELKKDFFPLVSKYHYAWQRF